MSYTIEDLVGIKMEAQELSNIAADYLGQMVYQLPSERNEKQISDKISRLQGKFSELHALMLGEFESGDLSDLEQKEGNEPGSVKELQGDTAQALRPQDLACYQSVVDELGEQGAIDELQKVIDSDVGIDDRAVLVTDAFTWNDSPQGLHFWRRVFSGL